MEIPTEILMTLIAALGTFIGWVAVYIKKRLKELDSLRDELTHLKVRIAELETEKKAVDEYLKERSRNRVKSLRDLENIN